MGEDGADDSQAIDDGNVGGGNGDKAADGGDLVIVTLVVVVVGHNQSLVPIPISMPRERVRVSGTRKITVSRFWVREPHMHVLCIFD